MTNEQTFFLKCLSDFCKGEKTDPPSEEMEIKLLFQMAEKHSLAGVIYVQCKSWIKDTEVMNGLSKDFMGDVFFSVNRQEMLRELTEKLLQKNISFVCMKGGVIRDSWPIPELRTMGDIDLIIQKKDRSKVDSIMLSELKFSKMVDNHSVWTYYFGPLEIEIHDHMFYEHLANDYDYRSYFDKIWENTCHGNVFGVEAENLYIPTPEFHFLYLITHTAKHFINNGVGLRAFMDMVFLTRDTNEMNWEWLESELEKIKLLGFTKVCFLLCEKWFNVQMPLSGYTMSDEFFEGITDKVFRDGVFGLDNPQNEAAHSAKELKRSKHSYVFGAISLTIKKLFPSYQNMQLIPWYSWVDGRPWLLPAAWFYRWGYCLVHKCRHSISLLSEPFSKKDIIDKRNKNLKNVGL